MKKIAFVQTSALGDCILATAVLHALRQREPNARITWIIFDQYREVAARNPDCDDYIAWPLKVGIPRQQQEHMLWQTMLGYADANFDEVIVPQVYPWRDWSKHEGMHLLDQMFEKAGVERPKDVRLIWPVSLYTDNNHVGCATANIVSRTQSPLWSKAKWQELGERLQEQGIRLVNGDEEGMTLDRWQDAIDRSECYIGLDSGGSWLAATTQTPQIVLYSSQSTCPHWLTSVKGAGVKDPALIHEMFDPTPEQVAAKVREIVR